MIRIFSFLKGPADGVISYEDYEKLPESFKRCFSDRCENLFVEPDGSPYKIECVTDLCKRMIADKKFSLKEAYYLASWMFIELYNDQELRELLNTIERSKFIPLSEIPLAP